jgi:hypothetical protein
MQGLWYSETAFNFFLRLLGDLTPLLGLGDLTAQWDFKVSTIREWIRIVDGAADRRRLQFRLDELIHISKKRPLNRSPLFPVFKVRTL